MSFEGIWWHNFTILTPQGIPRADDKTSLSFQSEQAAANPLNLCIRHIKITILYRIPVFSVGFFDYITLNVPSGAFSNVSLRIWSLSVRQSYLIATL